LAVGAAAPAKQRLRTCLIALVTAMQHEHHLLLHLAEAGGGADPLQTEEVPPWRMRERIKTSSLILVMALNLGVDPPDVIKPTPCARIECAPRPARRRRRRALPARASRTRPPVAPLAMAAALWSLWRFRPAQHESRLCSPPACPGAGSSRRWG
jgi:hypothetical protein